MAEPCSELSLDNQSVRAASCITGQAQQVESCRLVGDTDGVIERTVESLRLFGNQLTNLIHDLHDQVSGILTLNVYQTV